jgi:DNA-binding NtrC family response regulator
MQCEDIGIAAHSDVPVLIASDHALDREHCARTIHEQSRRARHPFVRFSAAALNARDGTVCRLLRDRFQQARGGTLFIDDVARLGAIGQRELSDLLERSIGSPPGRDVRILAGASRLLDSRRTAGAFNEALFYRLNEIRLDLAERQSPDT